MKPVKTGPVQGAKARFSEMPATCEREGPQIVTKRGVAAAALVPIEDWRRPSSRLKDLLLPDEARTDDLVIPSRQRFSARQPPKF